MLISFLGKVSEWGTDKPYKYKNKFYNKGKNENEEKNYLKDIREDLNENEGKNYLKDIIKDLNENKILFILTASLLKDENEKEAINKFIQEFGINEDITSDLELDNIDKKELKSSDITIYFISFDDISEKDKYYFEELYEKLNDKLSEKLDENEKIIVDITHSYRYLPFITLQIIDLLKIIKNIEVEGIIYAKEENDFYNLIYVDEIKEFFDYQKAFQNFVELGSLQHLANIIKDENLSEIISELDLALSLNFFKEIKEGFDKLKEEIEKFDEFPLSIISNHIIEFLANFEKERISEFQLELAKWHFKHKRLTLGLIALEESIRSKHIEKYEGKDCVFCRQCRTEAYKLFFGVDCRNKTDKKDKYWCMLKNLRNIAGHNLGNDESQGQIKDYEEIKEDYIEFRNKLLNNEKFVDCLYKEIDFGRQFKIERRNRIPCPNLCNQNSQNSNNCGERDTHNINEVNRDDF